jgi:pimeloyl-ACP methyl ester carboxylesterase
MRLAVLLTFALLVAAAPAGATVRFERMDGVRSPGTPARFDKVGILKVGPAKARNVLVLNPGTSASAAYFAPLARSIVARTRGWQVWAVERRENLLEDHSVLDRAKAGQATPQQLFDYYLGWLRDSSISPHTRLIPDAEVGYARRWGMATEIGDLRRVVLRAQRLGGKVVVGGHSLGGTIASA